MLLWKNYDHGPSTQAGDVGGMGRRAGVMGSDCPPAVDRIRDSLGYCAEASAWARASTEAEASAGISAQGLGLRRDLHWNQSWH